jgi:flagellar motility protein MotE (MotC chaperone)
MKRPGRGALIILALFLASSGALRVGGVVGQAMANANDPVAETVAPAECPTPPPALLKALNDREAQVAVQEAAAKDRMAALSLADAALTKRLEELAAAEASLKEVLAIADGAAEKDLARLTAVYEAMKPADAAAILSGMPPDKAYSISILIAGRNALAPKE